MDMQFKFTVLGEDEMEIVLDFNQNTDCIFRNHRMQINQAVSKDHSSAGGYRAEENNHRLLQLFKKARYRLPCRDS